MLYYMPTIAPTSALSAFAGSFWLIVTVVLSSVIIVVIAIACCYWCRRLSHHHSENLPEVANVPEQRTTPIVNETSGQSLLSTAAFDDTPPAFDEPPNLVKVVYQQSFVNSRLPKPDQQPTPADFVSEDQKLKNEENIELAVGSKKILEHQKMAHINQEELAKNEPNGEDSSKQIQIKERTSLNHLQVLNTPVAPAQDKPAESVSPHLF